MFIGRNIGYKKPDDKGRICLSKRLLADIKFDEKKDLFKVMSDGEKLQLVKVDLDKFDK